MIVQPDSEFKMLQFFRAIVAAARKTRKGYCVVPVAALARLLDKAERPHD